MWAPSFRMWEEVRELRDGCANHLTTMSQITIVIWEKSKSYIHLCKIKHESCQRVNYVFMSKTQCDFKKILVLWVFCLICFGKEDGLSLTTSCSELPEPEEKPQGENIASEYSLTFCGRYLPWASTIGELLLRSGWLFLFLFSFFISQLSQNAS